ncbi:MAG: hypothetical protein HYY17_09640 [Planctomycetes bacterium]|nr:hypothetical protein [Planctomycetota bacterium]
MPAPVDGAFSMSADGRFVAFRASDSHAAVIDLCRDLPLVLDIPLPDNVRCIAPSADGTGIAFADKDGIGFASKSSRVSSAPLPPDIGEPKSISVSPRTGRLYLTSESMTGNLLSTFDASHLRDTVPLEGGQDSHHEMLWAPPLDAFGVDVSCGQDGTWFHWFSEDVEAVRARNVLDCRHDPQGLAGFVSRDRFATVSSDRVRAWDLERLECHAQYEFPPETISDYHGAVWRGLFVVPLHSTTNDTTGLILLRGDDLALVHRIALSSGYVDTFCLPNGVVAIQDQRRWSLHRLADL